jgi:hypothetical protein
MPTQANNDAAVKTVETVQHLIALAQDEATTEEEARSAALKAIQLMKTYNLSVIGGSASDIESTLKSAKEAVETARQQVAHERQQSTQKMMLGAVGGFLLSKVVKGI